MSHTTLWRNRDYDLDLTPGLLHEEALDERAARGRPGCRGRRGDRRSLAYGDLAERVDAFAAGLRARGARRGDVLTLVASNGPDFPVAMHGALAAGLTLAPASPLLTARELGAFVRQVGARFVVADAGAMATAAEATTRAGVEAPLALALGGGPGSAEPEAVDPGAIALLMSSSGTTGLPKSAAHTHAGAVATVRGLASFPLTDLGPTTPSPGSSRWPTSSARSCSTRRCAPALAS